MENDKYTVGGFGRINIVGNELFYDDVPFILVLNGCDRRVCKFEFSFVDNYEQQYSIDEGILPLVNALTIAGFNTLSSCEGHVEGRPWVSIYSKDKPKIPVITGWELIQHASNVWRLQMKQGSTQEQMRLEILEAANSIR